MNLATEFYPVALAVARRMARQFPRLADDFDSAAGLVAVKLARRGRPFTRNQVARATRNACLDAWRKQRTRHRAWLRMVEARPDLEAPGDSGRIDAADQVEALERLQPRQRLALEALAERGRIADARRALGMSAGGAWELVKRAQAEARRLLVA